MPITMRNTIQHTHGEAGSMVGLVEFPDEFPAQDEEDGDGASETVFNRL